MITESELKIVAAAKLRMANSHMRMVRRHGQIMLGQTRMGTVELTYNAANRTYSIAIMNGSMTAYENLTAANCSITLQNLYTVEMN